jgi:hypothetical protein
MKRREKSKEKSGAHERIFLSRESRGKKQRRILTMNPANTIINRTVFAVTHGRPEETRIAGSRLRKIQMLVGIAPRIPSRHTQGRI